MNQVLVSLDKQPRPVGGHPVGTKIVRAGSHDAARRLQQMNFDPLEKLVKQYQKISGDLIWMESLRNDPVTTKSGFVHRYSKEAHIQLLTLQQKLLNDLMRYGYARVPETIIAEPPELPGITINLTPSTKEITDE
jgi:hypothetical protein